MLGRLRARLGSDRARPPVLRVRVCVTDDHRYHVELEPVGKDLDGAEYLRLLVHYYAQILFSYVPENGDLASAVREKMARLCLTSLDDAPDVLEVAGLRPMVTVVSERPAAGHHILATLSFESLARRHLTAAFSRGLEPCHAAYSTFVLIAHCLPLMARADRTMLRKALENMQRMYEAGYACSDHQNLSLVPNEALGLI